MGILKHKPFFFWIVTGLFAIIHSPYYILLFTFLLGYVYTIPVISLNNNPNLFDKFKIR